MPQTEGPGRLRKLLRAVGSFQADVVLTVFYWLALGVTALAVRLAGRDELGLRGGAPAWRPRQDIDPAEHLKAQG